MISVNTECTPKNDEFWLEQSWKSIANMVEDQQGAHLPFRSWRTDGGKCNSLFVDKWSFQPCTGPRYAHDWLKDHLQELKEISAPYWWNHFVFQSNAMHDSYSYITGTPEQLGLSAKLGHNPKDGFIITMNTCAPITEARFLTEEEVLPLGALYKRYLEIFDRIQWLVSNFTFTQGQSWSSDCKGRLVPNQSTVYVRKFDGPWIVVNSHAITLSMKKDPP